MKRSEMLILVANQVDFLEDKFCGFRTNFTKAELKRADVLLTTVEEVGILPPGVVNEAGNVVHKWEPEDE